MKKINIYVPDPDLAKLQELSKLRDVALAELIREAIREFLKTQNCA